MASTDTKKQDTSITPAADQSEPTTPATQDGEHEPIVHHGHGKEPRVIHPASSGTSHLEPGTINIKP